VRGRALVGCTLVGCSIDTDRDVVRKSVVKLAPLETRRT
jgi:hypothetical protein